MIVNALLEELERRDIRLASDGDSLTVRSRGGLSPDIREQLQAHKPELLRMLAAPHDQDAAVGISDPVFIDLETRSRTDLRERGGRDYAADPSTEILSVVALIDNTLIAWAPGSAADHVPEVAIPDAAAVLGFHGLSIVTFGGPDLPGPLRQALEQRRPLCAHNAWGFERHVWLVAGHSAPGGWIDTIPSARAAGLPGGLDEVARRLFGHGKDPAGARLLNRFSRPQSDGTFVEPSADEFAQLVQYNIVDVLLLERVYAAVSFYWEDEVLAADLQINGRGVAFDADLARALLQLEEEARAQIAAEAELLTQGQVTAADLNRVAFLREWLQQNGFEFPNLRRETVESFLQWANAQAPPVDPAVLAVIRARQSSSRNASSKLEKALNLLHSDGRLRDLLVYHKSHTGRWAGRGVQPQNLPKPHRNLQDIEAMVQQTGSLDQFRRTLPEGVSVEDGLSSLIRPCFVPAQGHVFCIADFASIEARGVAWCAREQGLLESFTQGEDVYCQFASRLFGYHVTHEHRHERDIGKIAVLGCGYQMSARRFGEYADMLGVDLSATGVTAEQVVEGYRNAYPEIAGHLVQDQDRAWRQFGLWRNVEQAVRETISSGRVWEVGRCRFEMSDGSLLVRLPSGRRVVYRNARLRDPAPSAPHWAKEEIVFDMPERLNETTYGGKLVENMVQGICRDLLADALVRCEQEGLPVVLHIHDEIVVEVPAERGEPALRRLLEIMSAQPAWAAGFPLEVEGFMATRFLKSPAPGHTALRFRNGELA